MRKLLSRSAGTSVVILALGWAGATAQEVVPTRVMVRVIARDAKIIGSNVGGVLVRVSDAETGDLLAEGQQSGTTGSTQLIMSAARTRDMSLYNTEGAAGYLAEIPLTEPTVVNIVAMGPLGYSQAVRSASKQMLLVPGGHIEGDGVVLELHGFIVEILAPEPLTPVGGTLDVKVRVRMMCGCPIEPGGMWDADNMTFVARLKADGRVVAAAELDYAGDSSIFGGKLIVPVARPEGDVTVEVIVADPGRQNIGRHELPLSG